MRFKMSTPLSLFLKGQRRLRKTMKGAFPFAITPPRKRARASVRPKIQELVEVSAFGSNPGRLRMLQFVPSTAQPPKALVVVLHGCLQTASDYHRGSGWARLARDKHLMLLYPEQRSQNNSNLCFNWFRPSAVARDRGEVGSIRQMIQHCVTKHRIPPNRIFIHGLSAGAAMAAALLVAYPELFRAGQLVAGLPYGAARDAMTALRVMRSGVERTPSEWGDLVRAARSESNYRHPAMSIWHGNSDKVVAPANGRASLVQWLDVIGLSEEGATTRPLVHGKVMSWKDASGRVVLDYHEVDGLDHGLPIKASAGKAKRQAYMLEGAVSAPRSFYDVFIKPT
ncbi:PHB depolymerase family esterase [Rhizobium sp. AAP43]|uniref:extracellular catalytic domain type 1 short-chain-length polyhydroxyalkanoate depolymerase n=1 Tax=Rhizobium sp. AAP43 TaxID=1523420 RepID=UPI0006B99781|nr:PHB depolymerase family esterase [Rhizobium sp. AAP43]KPF43129.1 polyhydroxybutyrate depolymerase [Rhizobium sp. AAP43]